MRHRFRIINEDDDAPDIHLSLRAKIRGGKLKAIHDADELMASKLRLSPDEKLIRLNETGMAQYEVKTSWSSDKIINPKGDY